MVEERIDLEQMFLQLAVAPGCGDDGPGSTLRAECAGWPPPAVVGAAGPGGGAGGARRTSSAACWASGRSATPAATCRCCSRPSPSRSTLTVVFAAVYGAVTAAGEFRHRTVTTAYSPPAAGRGARRQARRRRVRRRAVRRWWRCWWASRSGCSGRGPGVCPGPRAGRRGRRRDHGLRRCGARSVRPWACCSRNQVGALVVLLVYLQARRARDSAAVLNNSGSDALAAADPVPARQRRRRRDLRHPRAGAGGHRGRGQASSSSWPGSTAPPPWWGGSPSSPGCGPGAVLACGRRPPRHHLSESARRQRGVAT